MTLQSSGAIDMAAVMNELRIANPNRAFPFTLLDSDVLALAGKSGPPIALTDLYGKSAFTATGVSDTSGSYISTAAAGTASAFPSVTGAGWNNPTFAWAFTSNPQTATLSNANSSQCTVSKAYARSSSGSFNATLQCVVTNNGGSGPSITVSNIQATAQWNGNA